MKYIYKKLLVAAITAALASPLSSAFAGPLSSTVKITVTGAPVLLPIGTHPITICASGLPGQGDYIDINVPTFGNPRNYLKNGGWWPVRITANAPGGGGCKTIYDSTWLGYYNAGMLLTPGTYTVYSKIYRLPNYTSSTGPSFKLYFHY